MTYLTTAIPFKNCQCGSSHYGRLLPQELPAHLSVSMTLVSTPRRVFPLLCSIKVSLIYGWEPMGEDSREAMYWLKWYYIQVKLTPKGITQPVPMAAATPSGSSDLWLPPQSQLCGCLPKLVPGVAALITPLWLCHWWNPTDCQEFSSCYLKVHAFSLGRNHLPMKMGRAARKHSAVVVIGLRDRSSAKLYGGVFGISRK